MFSLPKRYYFIENAVWQIALPLMQHAVLSLMAGLTRATLFRSIC